MRASLALARRLPPHPRVLHRRPRISLAKNIASLCRYSNNAGSIENGQKQNQTHPDPLTNGPSASPFGTASKYLFASVVAAGLGYAYAASNQSSKPQSQPQSQSQTPSQSTEGPNYGSPQDYEKAIAELRTKLGEDAIDTDEDNLESHGYSEWSSINANRYPVAIAYPQSTEDVSKIAKVCYKYKIPMIPYSGGSSLEANFSAPHGGLTIDFVFMNRILDLHEADMDITVQPSIQWMELNEKIKDSGLFFPVDPGPSAMIGGMVGTNCSGTNAVRYGTMKDWVINLTVVLADGRVIKTRRRPRKTSAGYNLTGLFVGSEGTLGIVTEATLKLAVIPEQTRVGVVTFPTMRDAASTAMQVIRKGVPVQCMEILDDVQMDVINRAGGTSRSWKILPTLFFKFSGTTAGVGDSINLTTALAQQNKADTFEFAQSEKEAHDLWSARKQSLWSMLALRNEGSEVWSTDVSVPISRLPEIIEISSKELADLGLFASILGHIGDGNFHASIMYNRKDPDERARVEKVVHNMVDRALELEGSCTGEHGVGLGKKGSLKKELGLDTIDVMRGVKKSFDPLWLLNPGKIFDYDDKS